MHSPPPVNKSNIHTFDWNDEREDRPQATRVVYRDMDSDGEPVQTGASGKAQVYGVDGNLQDVEVTIPVNYLKLYGYSCCPCFIPPPCSPANSHRYCLFIFSACFILSFIQFVMLIVEISLQGFEKPSINWMLGPTSDAMDILGAKDAKKMKEQYELWRLITPIFLHAGIIHLVCNLSMQLRLGMIIERRMNTLRFLIVYFVGGIIGNCFSVMIFPTTQGVGASGALLAVFGGFLIDIILNKNKFPSRQWISLIGQLLISTIIIFVLSFMPGIDYAAHIFGFIGGAVAALGLLCHQNEWINKRMWLKIVIWISCIGFCFLVLLLTLLLLYLDVLHV
ncbi:hypothetical protein EIN_430110 [Entamoeba invadens IP1]|uniref:rhomboid protease n=1 Tax=Entamoeba invadens IP1 TaxID=370355 RepID=A0A0A1UF48_ENTIV|nr:hypothetical protein EIN_430110 [Entamoeba invadens IP1]ELP95215.1 hypothetical protein EIN_430110 [Entamoeba invadens IP1]|eukprot:XP_004261986.1 hypothetical protein EIN_430110 [Entamoeba invadens IP1]